MSDNVSITAGSGTTVAADNIAGVQYQRTKLSLGADGSAADAVGGSGVDSTGVQRVSLATNVALPAGTNQIGRILPHGRTVTTAYWFHTGALVVAAAADAANVGRVYIENDPDSSVFVVISRIRFKSQLGSALATPTSPRIVIRSFTFTGDTPSGAAITGVLQDSTFAPKNSNWNVRTAATGMTITEAGDICGFYPIAGATAVAYSPASVDEWVPVDPARPIILRAGQGIMVKQADAGTASDTRRFSLDFDIQECSAV